MKRLFLTSSFDGCGDFLKQVLPLQDKNALLPSSHSLGRKHTVAYIANAADLENDKSWTQSTRDKFEELNCELTDIDLRVTVHDELKAALDSFDIIYVEGGNNVYLLEISNESGFTEIVRDLVLNHNKLYIGTSAGSIHAGPSIESTMILDEPYKHKLTSFDALGLVDFVVIPHIGGTFNEWRNKEYLQMYTELPKFPYPHICLRDNQAVWVEDDKVQFVTYE